MVYMNNQNVWPDLGTIGLSFKFQVYLIHSGYTNITT